MKWLTDQRGYNLVELIVLMGILSVLAALVIANTRVGSVRQQTRDAAFGYVNAARQAEALAGSAQPVGGVPRKAYGVCITSSRVANSVCNVPSAGQPIDTYQVYARNVNDTTYTRSPGQAPVGQAPTILATFRTDPGVRATTTVAATETPRITFTSGNTWIDYLPPGPTLRSNGQGSPSCPGVTNLVVTSTGYTRTIGINACAGAVYVR